MDKVTAEARAKLKLRWLRLLKGRAGAIVVASAVLTSPVASASRSPTAETVSERAAQVRKFLQDKAPSNQAPAGTPERLAWWGRGWGNGGWGWHPGWHNWPNWHNWHNWPNWGNG